MFHGEPTGTRYSFLGCAPLFFFVEPFFRAREDSDVRGFGLGLPFVRAVARAHSGDVEISAEKAGRTSFVLRLPLLEWSEVAATA